MDYMSMMVGAQYCIARP